MVTPEFEGPDGIFRTEYIFTTTVSQRFFTGTTDPETVDMQVSVRGAGFTSDPDLIVFEGTTFIIPNPSVYPDGIQLLAGANPIQVKAVLTNGTATSIATLQANLTLEQDIKGVALPPSGVFIEKQDSTITVSVEAVDSNTVSGYHFYATTAAGGGNTGYTRINPNIVSIGEALEDTSTLGTLLVDTSVATTDDGVHAADPLFINVVGTQQDGDDVVLQTDFNESLEVPETTDQLRVSIVIDTVRTTQRYSFTHDRQATFDSAVNPAIPNSDFNTILPEEPLYYVVTAVYLIEGVEIESEFSPELSGNPLIITPNVGSFPTVSQQQILQDATLSIFRSQPQLRTDPGSTTKDTFLDPFSTEAERIRFIVDFLHNAQSFSTLLLIDDPGFTGNSIEVSLSPYKLAIRQAFYLQNDNAVQAVIDNAFDKLASNFGLTRRGGFRSRGAVVFSVSFQPEQAIALPLGSRVSGSAGVAFRTTSFSQITTIGVGAQFNPTTGRYSAQAFVQAEAPGLNGNLAPGGIGVVIDGPSGVQVTNESRLFGGKDEETNRDLANRAMTTLSAVDTGRFQGYVKTAIGVPGVLQVNVVDAGHPLMQRDIDSCTGEHVGGDVDIWIRGESVATVTDAFAFSFEIVKDMTFEVIGSPTNLDFRAVDQKLSVANPIIEMLEYPTLGMEFVNTTTSRVYDLTNVEVTGYNSIRLDSTYNSALGIAMTDVFTGAYRYRTSDKYVFVRQPVREISSFVGDPDRSGTVDRDLYALYKGSDPLLLGRSSEAGDYLKVTQPIGETTITIPSSDPIQVADEGHVMLDGIEYLNNLGVNQLTVQVFNVDRSTQFLGPFDPLPTGKVEPDFTFIDEEGSNPLGILLTDTSDIGEGDSVLVDYSHDENFVVAYTYNSLVGIAQEEIDEFRHITADALVKEAVPVEVGISATVVVRSGQDAGIVDSDIQTAIAQLFASLALGEPLRQSDVIEAIDVVLGVSYVVVPLIKLAKGEGSLVVREPIPTDQETDVFEVEDWRTNTNRTYLIKNSLDSATSDAGGPINESRGVFASEVLLANQEVPPNLSGIPMKNLVGSAFIVGSLGLVIPGYSDETTLEQAYPFATPAELDEKRVEITGNRVLVTIADGDLPLNYDYTVTYIVSDDTSVKNIEPGSTEYLDIGDLDFTYDEDVDFTARVTGRVR